MYNTKSVSILGNSKTNRNEKGETTTWDSNEDGISLKVIVQSGILDGLTGICLRIKYPQFQKYSYSCFNSALGNAWKTFNNQVHARSQHRAHISSTCK